MVCLGNICRSPLAEGILRSKIKKEGLQIIVDSAGTSGQHAGEQADKRMINTASNFGIDISDLRSRKFTYNDYQVFDIIYTMDQSNYRNVLALARTDEEKSKVRLILDELYPGKNNEVPDPYFGGEKGFIEVYQLLDAASDQIINKLKTNG